jgi:hypothetical protein
MKRCRTTAKAAGGVLTAKQAPTGPAPPRRRAAACSTWPTGIIVARALSMPHSPRLHDGWLRPLESATRRIMLVDSSTGSPLRQFMEGF